ncbi:MAG: hypothetical protein ABL984_00340 [Pyrinomonadaceae bacterium]
MPTTPILGITELTESQANKHVTINLALQTLDGAIGRDLAVATKTTTASWTKTDGLFLSAHTAAVTYTLPATTGLAAPYVGQRFRVMDVSAAGAGTYPITIAVPSGNELDGVTNGTAVIYSDKGWVEVVFVSDALGYFIVDGKGLLMADDEYVNITEWMGSPTSQTNNAVTLPTASNHVPGYIPFTPSRDVGIDQVIFPFGSSGPSSDATTARMRFGFYDSSAHLPANLLWSTEDTILQGASHVRTTTPTFIGDIGSLTTSLGIATLAARRVFKAGKLYYFAYHLEPTFSAGVGCEVTRVSMGYQVRKLSAGAQAWGYAFGASPTTGIQFGSDTLQRLQVGFRMRRVR